MSGFSCFREVPAAAAYRSKHPLVRHRRGTPETERRIGRRQVGDLAFLWVLYTARLIKPTTLFQMDKSHLDFTTGDDSRRASHAAG
jgi:hypothetical protein